MYGFQSKQAQEFPPIVILDLTNVCNSECIHCPHPRLKRLHHYRPTFLDWEIYEKVIDEISENKVTVIRYSADGEPLLHPEFLKMIAYAKKKRVGPLNLTTNGILLDENVTKSLLQMEIDIIDISIDACTKEKYERIRRKSDFDRVMRNVHKLLEIRDKKKTKVMVSIVDQPEGHDEVEAFKRYWTPLVDRVLVRTFINIHGLVKIPLENSLEKIERYPCPQLWKRVSVKSSAHLGFCVTDWLGKGNLADLRTATTIQKIWKGDLYQRMRALHLAGRFDQIPLCRDCQDWLSSTWDYGYELAVKQIMKKNRAG